MEQTPARSASSSGEASSPEPVEATVRQPSAGDDGSGAAAGRKSQRLPYRLRAVCVHCLLHEYTKLQRHRCQSTRHRSLRGYLQALNALSLLLEGCLVSMQHPWLSLDPFVGMQVGHSLGGASLLIYAVTSALKGRPDRIYRLILLTPAGFLKTSPIPWVRPLVDVPFRSRLSQHLTPTPRSDVMRMCKAHTHYGGHTQHRWCS